uniref:Uncharacterized protein n=1 Tax=Ceratitis capitata TaxID=7213 RepID=W8BN13_CERCA
MHLYIHKCIYNNFTLKHTHTHTTSTSVSERVCVCTCVFESVRLPACICVHCPDYITHECRPNLTYNCQAKRLPTTIKNNNINKKKSVIIITTTKTRTIKIENARKKINKQKI